MFKKKSDIYNLVLVVLAVVITIIVYSKLPEQIPTHWNIEGQIDGYSAKSFGAIMMPALMTLMWGLMVVLPKIDPRKQNYEKFAKSYSVIISVILTLFFTMHIITIMAALGYNVSINKILPVLIGIILIVLGNYMPKMKSNFFCGIKTPWTLSSNLSWKKTHRLGGKLSVIAGIVMIFSGLFLSGTLEVAVIIGVALVATIIPIVASYFYAKNDESKNAN